MNMYKARLRTPLEKKNVFSLFVKRDGPLETVARDRDNPILPKPQKADIGSFVGDAIKKVKEGVDWLLGYETTRFKQFLKAHGVEKITKLAAGRVPIEKAVRLGFNLIAGGEFEEAHKKLGVDNFFHLYLIINDKYIIEKNETVNFKPYSANSKEERIEIPIKREMDIATLIQNAAKGNEKAFWSEYNPLGNNCQQWVSRVLTRNGLMNSTVKSFVNQDMEGLLKHLPSYVPKTAEHITDVASILNRILQFTTGGRLGFAVGNKDVGDGRDGLVRPKRQGRKHGFLKMR